MARGFWMHRPETFFSDLPGHLPMRHPRLRSLSLARGAFPMSLLLALAACGGDTGTPTVPDPDGDDEEDEAVAWDPTALAQIRNLMDTTHVSGFVLFFKDEIVAEGYNEDPDLRGLDEELVAAWEATRRPATQTGFPVEDVGEVQTAVAALLAMRASEEGLLDLDAAVTAYLGSGWSRASETDESGITVRHLLSMTSGLDAELRREAAPGTLWRYNLPAYRVLLDVLPAATGFGMQGLTQLWLTEQMGLEFAEWFTREDGTLGFATTPRDLVAIGQLILARGVYQGDRIMEAASIVPLVRPSQDLNPAYGLHWWLNGRTPLIRPDGSEPDEWLLPTAPEDLVITFGEHDRILAIIPSRNVVFVRYGAWVEGPGRWDSLEEFWTLVTQSAPR